MPRPPTPPPRLAPDRAAIACLVLLAACEPPVGPKPSLEAATPDLACATAAAVQITVTGAGFAPVPTNLLVEPRLELPTLTLTRAGDVTGAADDVDAAPILLSPADGTLQWVDAQTLLFSASPALGLVPGAWDLALANPDGQGATLAAGLLWTSPPEVADVSPANVCIDAPAAPLTLTGEGFLFYDGVGPTVTAGDADPVEATPGVCSPLAGDRDGWVCTSILVEIDATEQPLGDVPLVVANPAPASCASLAPAVFTVSLPPEITGVSPAQTCSDGGTLIVTGERLPEDPTVTIGGVPATSVTAIGANTLEVVVGPDTPAGDVELVVEGVDGCPATATVTIVGEPDVFFVDPPAVYEGLTIEVTAWLADLSGDVTEVWITDSAGTRTDLAFEWDPADPDRVEATIPAGLPAGSYAFGFSQSDGCDAELADALVVADTLGIAVDRLEPGYAWAYDYTPVQVFAEDPLPAGFVGFLDTPRVYVTATGGAGDATGLGGVSFRDDGLLTATVPPGLAPGAYDVLVVNPDHTVGLLPAGLVVTEERPPTVTSVSPPGLSNQDDETVRIAGADFRDPTVSLTCREDGVERTVSTTVLASTYTTIDAVVPSEGFGDAVCIVEVVNADGPSARWAALSIRNPSENLFPWSAGTDMVEARRAPVAAAGRTSAVDRWVYAVGGDEGDASSARTSVERAPMGVYGELGAWELLPTQLPAPVTLAAGATIGEFVYVVGGNDGLGPVATAWRAHVLDPLAVPRFDALSIDDGGALDGGSWTWRVAALFDTTDPSNPGGESLVGDPIAVVLPEVGGLSVELSWTEVEGAVGYRVYRTPTADTSGELEWVGDTVGLSFLDDGVPTDPSRTPLPEGALGEWVALPAMLQAREAPCLAVAPDPIPDPEIVHLYVAGGRAPDGDALDSVEVLDVQIVNDREHLADAWYDAGVTLEDAAWGCGGWVVDASRHSVVTAEETWIYFGAGQSESRTYGSVSAGLVGEYGVIEGWGEIDSMSPARAGFAAVAASDFLYAFGGQQGDPSTGGVSAELGIEPMPEVRNWNSLGVSLTEARLYPGFAQESAVLVLTGGTTETADATRSTDVTNW